MFLKRNRSLIYGLASAALACSLAAGAQTPDVGTRAPDFTLATPEGQSVSLQSLLGHGDVALIVLRGYPGYQCPLCMKQVHDLEANADKFAAKGIHVLMIYPGNASQLDEKAKEFVGAQPLPANFHLVVDPDFKVVNQYSLRWDAPHETSYPSTFLLDKNGKVLYRKISHTHGDRASTEDILAAAK